MRITKYLKLLALPSILLALLITGFSLKKSDSRSLYIQSIADSEQVEGISEFYFKPAGDERLWHIINKYGCTNSNGERTLNNSSYTFTSDSVLVVNEIATVPDWEPYISGLIFKKN
jgi:hypothetical protein